MSIDFTNVDNTYGNPRLEQEIDSDRLVYLVGSTKGSHANLAIAELLAKVQHDIRQEESALKRLRDDVNVRERNLNSFNTTFDELLESLKKNI
jgi:hypothetical protein